MRMKSVAMFTALLLWVGTCLGQNVSLPDQIKAKAGRMVKLKATTPADAQGSPLYKVYWDTGVLEPGVDFDFIPLGTNEVIMLFPADLLIKAQNKFSAFSEGGNKFKIQAVIASDKNKIETAATWVVIDQPIPPTPPTPPGPTPPTPPTPPEPPDPFSKVDYGTNPFKAAGGLRVLILYESADLGKLPQAQQAILFDKSIRDYLNSHCAQGDKVKEWRIWDKDVDAKNESALFQKVLARPHSTMPWIVIGNGKTGWEGPLPADVPSTLKLIQKYGGQ